jgi:hypothetical protein
MTMSKEEKRRRREERRLEKRFSVLEQAIRMLEAAEPVDGLYTVVDVIFDDDERREKLAELKQESCGLINQLMLLYPEIFVQYPNGDWTLRENASRNDLQ